MNFNLPIDLSRLQNDRLKLVSLQENLNEWADAYVHDANSHPHVYDWLTYGPFASGEQYVSFYNEHSRDNESELLLAIVLSDGTFAGLCGLVSQPERSTVDMGQLLLTSFQRTYVGTAANALLLHACLDSDHLALRRVQWQCNSRNTASVNAAKRLGFQWEGIIRWQQVLPSHKTGEVGDGLPRVGPGRHTAMLSLCWDDWVNGGREHVDNLTNR